MRNEINLGEKQAHCSEIEPAVVGGGGGSFIHQPPNYPLLTNRELVDPPRQRDRLRPNQRR